MDITIQNPSATLAFGSAEKAGAYASLSTVGSSVTTAGLKTPGAIRIETLVSQTRSGVVTSLFKVQVPLFVVEADGCCCSSGAAKKGATPFAQIQLAVSLPNREGVVATASDFDASGLPKTQAAANASAIALGVQIVLNAIANQGTGVLAAGKDLFNYAMLGTDVASNPIARGLMGLIPTDGSNRSIKTVSA